MATGMRGGPAQAEAAGEGRRSGTSTRVWVALAAVCLIWGSTYLALRIVVRDIPPALMAGSRFLIAGGCLFAYLRWRGEPYPTARQWRGAAVIGTLMVGSNVLVASAEMRVGSAVAALMVSIVPIWTALLGGWWGTWPTRQEWLGVLIGITGIALLNSGGDLRANPADAGMLLTSTITWSLGSMLGRRLPLPRGAMASAAEMLAGGIIVLLAGLAVGERLTSLPSTASVWAFLYLVVAGSLIAYSAYMYLLARVTPTLATSYTYVNPIVAVALGAGIAGEPIGGHAFLAMAVILAGVAMVVLSPRKESI